MEDFRPGQAQTDGPHTHGRIFLLGQMEIRRLFVCADVQGTDHHPLAVHFFRYGLIRLELLLLSGIILTLQIEKLAAKQADAFGVVG